jgi:hypothetical protein
MYRMLTGKERRGTAWFLAGVCKLREIRKKIGKGNAFIFR